MSLSTQYAGLSAGKISVGVVPDLSGTFIVHAPNPNGTDDTSTLNGLLTAGARVLLQPGAYKTSAALNVPNGAALVGAGIGVTTISATTSGDVVSVAASANEWMISDLSILASGAANGIHALAAANVGVIARVSIANATTGNGISLASSNEVTIRDCNLVNNLRGVLLNYPSNSCQIIHCNINAQSVSGGVGVQVQPSTDRTLIIGCNFEGNAYGGSAIVCSGTTATTIVACYFEQWVGACVQANSGIAKALTVIGNSMQATSSAAACILSNSTGPNDGVTVTGNHFPTLGNTGMTTAGVTLGGTTNAYVRGNRSSGASTTIVSGQTAADYLGIAPATTTTAPAAGGAGALPATPTGYMTVMIGGVTRQVAYY